MEIATLKTKEEIYLISKTCTDKSNKEICITAMAQWGDQEYNQGIYNTKHKYRFNFAWGVIVGAIVTLLSMLFFNSCYAQEATHRNQKEIKRMPLHFYYERALYNFYKRCNYPAAIKDMDFYIKNADGNKVISAYSIKATSESIIGQDSLAIIDFKQLLLLNKERKILYDSDKEKVLINLSDIYFNLCLAYKGVGDNYNAMRAINKAIFLNNKDKSYYELRRQIPLGMLSIK